MKSRLVWFLLCGIWGSTWLFIKLGLADLPPITFAGIRFLIAATILFCLIALRRLSLPRNRGDWILLAFTGVLAFSLNYGLLFWGEQYISSGLASLLQATIPAFGLVIAHFYLPEEQMTATKIGGVLLGGWSWRNLFKPTGCSGDQSIGWKRSFSLEFDMRCLFERVG